MSLTTDDLNTHRPALLAHCYRMLGSLDDAEDAVQDALVRAWRFGDGFARRSSARRWLHAIATRTCLDALAGRRRRGLPLSLPGPHDPTTLPPTAWAAEAWVEPVPDLVADDDVVERIGRHQSVRLAFITALQRLPPRQRAVLLLRDVLGWSAAEVAEHLEMTATAVHSAAQRARATLATDAAQVVDAEPDAAVVGRYLSAFEAYDLSAIAGMLHEDVTMCMPPHPMWLRGPDAVVTWMGGIGVGCAGSRLLPTRANGGPAFGQYRPATGGGWAPWSLILLELRGDRIVTIGHHLDTARLFPRFGLPLTLPSVA